MKKKLPIGIDSFREMMENYDGYIDKSLMIMDFIEYNDKVALITRPRRFGKTLNMTMLREFFDITVDSEEIFKGLAIMETEYANDMNSYPVIFLSFKDCKADTREELLKNISNVVFKEYKKYSGVFKNGTDKEEPELHRFFMIYDMLLNGTITDHWLQISIETLELALCKFYKIKPIVLIDEYDQPLISGFAEGYHDSLVNFFSGFYGAALKGQDYLYRALLTGIQRVVKESIFSQLNNIIVYTVTDEPYSGYFGFTEYETRKLLSKYDMELDEQVKQHYDGYRFGKAEVYNPWSVLNYIKTGQVKNYWVNTSTNTLIRKSIVEADDLFHKDFDALISGGSVEVSADLECSFYELNHRDTLWGLLINSGYLTVLSTGNSLSDSDSTSLLPTGYVVHVSIPNGEVRSEFVKIIADRANIQSRDLQKMFAYLFEKDIDGFIQIYQQIVLSCTSYFDAEENAYHMLFLGMCISLSDIYKITSNLESGYGRYDICLESLDSARPHIVIEFKNGENIDKLKDEALAQIKSNRYYDKLTGEVLCLGVAHNKKHCAVAYESIRRAAR